MTGAARPVVVGIADHSGWANLVTIGAGPDGAPLVVDRRRYDIVGPDDVRQPYHAAAGLDEAEAEALVASVGDVAAAGARAALADLAGLLAARGDGDGGPATIVALAMRSGSDRALPSTMAGILARHAAMHMAEGELYREAWAAAADERGVPVALHPRGEAESLAAAALGTTADRLAGLLAALGQPLGPPWRAEHKEAAAAALGELAEHTRLALPRF
ncbi:MAG TPA: hypothetical protein VKD21_06020 [Acidimicrobiales bacterium]|nr:hypothetical protein [Acidimicrobiales bacterium]